MTSLAALLRAAESEAGKSLRAFAEMAWRLIKAETFVPNWHIDAVCDHLEAVTAGHIQRLLILQPPGTMKSLLVSAFWPAWEWGPHGSPSTRWMFGSYAQYLSNESAKYHRDIVSSDWFRARWPHCQISNAETKKIESFQNSGKGVRYSTSVGGGAMGRHVHRLVFDDLIQARDAQGRAAVTMGAIDKANDFWFGAMSTRRADPKTTTYTGIMQRLHFEDTAGKCIEQGYTVLKLPMEFDSRDRCFVEVTGFSDPRTEDGELLWPERYPRDVVEADKGTLGALHAEAQMQQNPAPLKGALFRAEWLAATWDPETLDPLSRIITVDCTFKDLTTSDYVVVQAWARWGRHYALLDQSRGKWDITRTVDAIREMRDWHPHAVVHVEDKANGPAVVSLLKKEMGTGVKEWSPGSNSKEERAVAVSYLFEQGAVLLPPDKLAPWKGDYIAELLKFPVGRHDDQVDCTTMALLILREKGVSVLDAHRRKLRVG